MHLDHVGEIEWRWLMKGTCVPGFPRNPLIAVIARRARPCASPSNVCRHGRIGRSPEHGGSDVAEGAMPRGAECCDLIPHAE